MLLELYIIRLAACYVHITVYTYGNNTVYRNEEEWQMRACKINAIAIEFFNQMSLSGRIEVLYR